MTARRPLVLVAIEPPLLADLVGRALTAGGVDRVAVVGRRAGRRRWDVAVVHADARRRVRARHVVRLADAPATDLGALVDLVRRLCEVGAAPIR